MSGPGQAVGLIAGNGQLPLLFARGARRQGLKVVAAAVRGEADPALEAEVDVLEWVHAGQLGRVLRLWRKEQVREAAMAGGIGKLRAFRTVRFDALALRVLARLRSFNDDGLLKALAALFEAQGIRIIAATEHLKEVLAARGRLGRLDLTPAQRRDVALGAQVAHALGRADVGQTVVTCRGHVVAVEACEGTDACIRRAGELAGPGIVVVKRCKPQQDRRFDLPTVGPVTLETLAQVRGAVLAVEAERTILLDAPRVARLADEAGIAVVGEAFDEAPGARPAAAESGPDQPARNGASSSA